MDKKLKFLYKIINNFHSIIVAYSGGVDSSLILYLCKKLNKKVLAVTASSETYTKEELTFAKKFTKKYKIPHKIIKTSELNSKKFVKNPLNRCYYCKNELFNKINLLKQKLRYEVIFDGTNYDDIKNDVRPGTKAAEKFSILHPLAEAKFTKKEIRNLSKKLRLPTWSKPQLACLASRIPFGEKITKEKLKIVEKAEKIIKKYIPYFFRLRHHNKLARIEVEKTKIKQVVLNKNLQKLSKELKKLGYKFVCIDIDGYILSGKRT